MRFGSDRAVSPGAQLLDPTLPRTATGRLRRPIDAGRKSYKMAPGAHDLVFRDFRFEGLDAGISTCRPRIRVSF